MYIDHDFPVGKIQHYVIDTDYENYAIVYGCKRFMGIFVFSYATLLSRYPTIEYKFVRKAQEKLEEIKYDHGSLWVETGSYCGFDAHNVPDMEILNVLKNQPNWKDYASSANTRRFKYLYSGFGFGDKLPTGTLDGNLAWKGSLLGVKNSLPSTIYETEFEYFYRFKNMQYNHQIDDLFVDVWIMTQPLADESSALLSFAASFINTNEIPSVCCYT